MSKELLDDYVKVRTQIMMGFVENRSLERDLNLFYTLGIDDYFSSSMNDVHGFLLIVGCSFSLTTGEKIRILEDLADEFNPQQASRLVNIFFEEINEMLEMQLDDSGVSLRFHRC